MACARARVRRDSHPGWGRGRGPLVRRGHLPSESGPLPSPVHPSSIPLLSSSSPLRSPCPRRTRDCGVGDPRRCTRGPNPFPGERTPTAFSRYAPLDPGVILADDYIAGMPAGAQPRTECITRVLARTAIYRALMIDRGNVRGI